METANPTIPEKELSRPMALLLLAVAVLAFQLAYTFPACAFLIAVFLWCLFQLTRLGTARQAFYFGLVTGLLCYAPQSGFFWSIFNSAALALWTILALWIGLFVALGRLARLHFGKTAGVLLLPFLWTGLEYFRSELYYLRFSWLNIGYVFSTGAETSLIGFTGVYGAGFLLMVAIATISLMNPRKQLVTFATLLALLAVITNMPPIRFPTAASSKDPIVAGVQLEFPSEQQVIWNLDKLVKQNPDAQLLVLSEYTFTGPVPEKIKDWCRKRQRYLVVGAKDPVSGDDYYDTAFVIGPTGDIVFHQGKCVPIQFFKDGLPAREQKLWDSPWGKIGFCVCYDLSYTRVTDELIRLGAQAIIVPTMDVVDWGRHQHELHSRIAPARVAEYGVPVFRMASSGISQFIAADGRVLATAPMPGEEATLLATLHPATHGRLPYDRFIAPCAVAITALSICWFVVCACQRKKTPKPDQP